MALIKAANTLMNMEAPWKTIKEDKEKAGTTICVLANVVKAAAIMLYPIIPESSAKILKYLGMEDGVKWEYIDRIIEETHIDPNFKPVFYKINTEEIKEKLAKMRETTQLVSIKEFEKFKLYIGRIIEVTDIVGRENLYYLRIKVGNKVYGSVVGLKQSYKPHELINKKVVVITNIKPRKILGYISEVMLLAAKDDNMISLLTVDRDIEDGAEVY